jgi:enamine deaminase RidA (YjgF/YER057c/UK114 family)
MRIGSTVVVAGTTATTREGGFVGEGDPYAQAKQILSNIEWALAQAGATFADVVRYRAYVVRVDDWPDVGRALSEAFGDVRPVSTLVGVPWLVDPRMLVEIDVDAIVGSAGADDR